MKLTIDQVRHVAKLANLSLSHEEEAKYSGQLSNILGYIEQLNEVDTSNVEPTFNVSSQSNVTSEDNPQDFLTQDEAIANAVKVQTGFFVTKGVFED